MNPTTRQVMRQWTLAQPVIASYITALVRDFAIRDDLLQDVAVAVLESVDRYDPSKPFIGWAIGITRNILRNHFRRSSRDRLIFDDELTGKLAVAFEDAFPTTLSQLDLSLAELPNNLLCSELPSSWHLLPSLGLRQQRFSL